MTKQARMAAKDLFHEAVRRGLEKQQWTITDDPLELEWEEVKVKIDLAAERLIAAERGGEKIAVELKALSELQPLAISIRLWGSFSTIELCWK